MPLTINQLMEKMSGAFLPEKAQGVNAIIHFKATLIINPESIPAETFILYPNPVTEGNISLLYAQDWANGILTISNQIGQVLYTNSLSEISKQNNILNVSNLTTGDYFIHIKTDSKRIVKTLVIGK